MKDLIVISGGGFSQVETGLGCLKALEEKGLLVNSQHAVDYKATSAGAKCSALMSSGMTPGEAITMIRTHPTDTLITRRWFWPVRLLFGQSIYDRSGLEALLKKHIPEKPLINVDVSVTNAETMRNMRLPGAYDTTLASGSIDGIFDPVRLAANVLGIDGGYTDNVPYEPRMLDHYRYVFIILYPADPDPERHLQTLIGRLLEGFSTKISQVVIEAERVYDNPDCYPCITVLRPPPIETSLLSWSDDYSLVAWAYLYAKKKLERVFPNGIH